MRVPVVQYLSAAPKGAGARFRWKRGVKAGHPCWMWEQEGKKYYNGIERYPRRSELVPTHIWSGVFKAQEDIITALVDLEFEAGLLLAAIPTAKGRLIDVKSKCAITGGVQTQVMKSKTDAIDKLLDKLSLASELLQSPATDRWMLLWSMIEWPEWELPKVEWAQEAE